MCSSTVREDNRRVERPCYKRREAYIGLSKSQNTGREPRVLTCRKGCCLPARRGRGKSLEEREDVQGGQRKTRDIRGGGLLLCVGEFGQEIK